MSEDLVHNFVARDLVNICSSYNNSNNNNNNKFRLGFAPVQLLFLVSIWIVIVVFVFFLISDFHLLIANLFLRGSIELFLARKDDRFRSRASLSGHRIDILVFFCFHLLIINLFLRGSVEFFLVGNMAGFAPVLLFLIIVLSSSSFSVSTSSLLTFFFEEVSIFFL